MFDKVLGIIAPHTCYSCGILGALLCEHCIENIVSEPYSLCISCQKPVGGQTNGCNRCHTVEPWDAAWVAGERSGALRQLIDAYKFERATSAATTLARLLGERIPLLPDTTIVTYIPSSGAHRRQRGYDTMRRVAKEYAKHTGLKEQALVTRKYDLAQRGVDRKTRLIQQFDALAIQKTEVDGPILLLDDVYTTGGTVRAASTKLKEVYDVPVYVGMIARQPLDDLSDL